MKKSIISSVVFLMIFPVLSSAAENPQVFKLGFMSGLTGPLAATAETQKKGIFLAVDQYNARGGLNMPWGKVKIEVITKDDEMKLDIGVRRFREMIAEGINGVTGTAYNPMASALNEELKITSIPYLAACVPAFDSFKKGNMAEGNFAVAFTPWSVGYLGGACMSKIMGKKKIFHLSRSDSWGKFIRMGLDQALKEFGGEVIGSAESPLGTIDYTSMINKAKAMKPDVLYNDFFGSDAIASFKQSYELGFYNVSTMFNAWTVNAVAIGIPEKALAGMYALQYHYHDLENFEDKEAARQGKEFADAHMKKYGEPPDGYTVIAYVSANLMFQAVERAGSFDVKEVSKVLREAKDLNTVKGPVYFREDHQMVSKYSAFLLKGKDPNEKKGKWDLYKVVGAFGGESALPPLKLLGY